MSERTSLIGIVGSLRNESITRAVFNASVEIFREQGVELVEASLQEVPFYNGDVESAGDPRSVTALKGAVESSDGLVIFTPEYNRSVPAVTKNAVDWLSRPYGASPLAGMPVGIVAQSPGGHDAPGVRAHLSVSVEANTNLLFPETLGIGRAQSVPDDEEKRRAIAAWCGRFAAFVHEASRVEV